MSTHQTAVVDLYPTVNALHCLLFNPILRRYNRTILSIDICWDDLEDSIYWEIAE
jgi:hypothetical protein